MPEKNGKTARLRRKMSIRNRVVGTSARPRLTVFRSNSHIYAQIIDDTSGVTLAAASDAGKKLAKDLEGADGKLGRAKVVGQAIAKACLDKGISKVVFDRNGYVYRSSAESEEGSIKPTRITALAEAAREAGLEF